MKVNINYKGKSVELDIPDEKLEELVKERKQTGWEKPSENGSVYYFVNHLGEVAPDGNFGLGHCAKCYERGNCFTSKELAENIARYQSLDLRIRRRIAEICEPVNWRSGMWNFDIVYLHPESKLITGEVKHAQSATWCCDTREHALQIIEEFKDDLLWYFTEFKDRMDG